MSFPNNRPAPMVAAEEAARLSRSVLVWLNTFPELPVGVIDYEYLSDAPCMALSTVQGASVVRRYITGGYQAEYTFKVVYRIRPGKSMDKRLKADELLDRLAAWAEGQRPELGAGIRPLRVEAVALSTLFARYESGEEDHQILMKLTYEVI